MLGRETKCAECGKLFITSVDFRVVCSDSCKNRRYARQLKRGKKFIKLDIKVDPVDPNDIWHEENIKANQWRGEL